MRMYFFFIFIFTLSIFGCETKKGENKMQQVMGLQKMSELATAEYVVTKIIKANDNKTWYKAGDRKILMTCKATLVAGIDLSGISEKDVNMEGQNISLTLPRAKLIYINIKPEDIRTAYEDISMFRSPFSLEEKNQLATQAENQLRAGANSLGIYTTAETNATIFINNFLRKAGFNNISIDFSANKNILR